MAVYRNVQVNFWQDDFVLDLTPEERYFYIYLLTCSKTTQCGMYSLPKRLAEMETGYNRRLLRSYCSALLIMERYCTMRKRRSYIF